MENEAGVLVGTVNEKPRWLLPYLPRSRKTCTEALFPVLGSGTKRRLAIRPLARYAATMSVYIGYWSAYEYWRVSDALPVPTPSRAIRSAAFVWGIRMESWMRLGCRCTSWSSGKRSRADGQPRVPRVECRFSGWIFRPVARRAVHQLARAVLRGDGDGSCRWSSLFGMAVSCARDMRTMATSEVFGNARL